MTRRRVGGGADGMRRGIHPSTWWTRAASMSVVPLLLILIACDDPIELVDEAVCPQTYEFGNYGCARFLLLIEGPSKPWPDSYRWSIWARAASPDIDATSFRDDPKEGQVELQLTLMWGRVHGDTASFWVSAELLDDPRPVQVGVPLPIFAADSALRLARFVAVGQVAIVDTVHLTLVGPNGAQ